MRNPRHLIAALALASVTVLAACGGDQEPALDSDQGATSEGGSAQTDDGAIPEPGPGEGETVFINTFIFRPDPITVPAGTTVTWIQNDSTTHTVTSGDRDAGPDGLFDASLAKGETFEHTFDEPGTYDYFCSLHSGPGMTGQVIVE